MKNKGLLIGCGVGAVLVVIIIGIVMWGVGIYNDLVVIGTAGVIKSTIGTAGVIESTNYIFCDDYFSLCDNNNNHCDNIYY